MNLSLKFQVTCRSEATLISQKRHVIDSICAGKAFCDAVLPLVKPACLKDIYFGLNHMEI